MKVFHFHPVDDVMNLNLSRISSSSPHCIEERAVRYLAIAVPVKWLESLKISFSILFLKNRYLRLHLKYVHCLAKYGHRVHGTMQRSEMMHDLNIR